MTYDYKPADRRKVADRRELAPPPTPGWIWLLAGLVFGLAIALAIYLSDAATGSRPTLSSVQSSESNHLTDARTVRKSPGAAPIPAPPPSRFDFYTILPEMEVAIPQAEPPAKPHEELPQMGQPGTYLLQAGSFQSFGEADRLRAGLILLGIEASIQTITVNNKNTWYRVHIGPYKDLAKLNEVRIRLKQNKIETVLLKVKT